MQKDLNNSSQLSDANGDEDGDHLPYAHLHRLLTQSLCLPKRGKLPSLRHLVHQSVKREYRGQRLFNNDFQTVQCSLIERILPETAQIWDSSSAWYTVKCHGTLHIYVYMQCM